MIYWLGRGLLGPLVRLCWVKKVEGRRNVPRRGPVILAANHASFLDFAILVQACPRRIYFLAAEFLFSIPVIRVILKKTGQVKVPKENRKAVYEESLKILGRGRVLGIFPEGTRTHNGFTQRAFEGVAKIALAAKADIVPVALSGTYQVFSRHHRRPKLKRVCGAKFLTPLKYESFKSLTPEEIVHRKLMPEIARELGHEYFGG